MYAALKTLLMALIEKLVVNVGGFQGWVLEKALQYGGKQLLEAVKKAIDILKRAFEQKKAEEKKDEVVNDPKSSVQQIGEGYEDFFNSGRGSKPE